MVHWRSKQRAAPARSSKESHFVPLASGVCDVI